MNSFLNYIIEANIGLLLFLGFYKLCLNHETNFGLLRILLLSGIFASLLLPLIHVQNSQEPSAFLSIGRVIPAYWLPEVVVGMPATAGTPEPSFHFWKYTAVVYGAGSILFVLILLMQLMQIFRIMRNSQTYRLQRFLIAESVEDKPTFSFFHFIFIGKSDRLSKSEKQQIIRHESVHALKWHSFDILLLNFLRIIFWFNPLLSTYKKIFIQLHEFEADARAVENSDLDKYCSLLAKIALQSADFSLASHFNYSLTLKRIEMMRTIKSNVKRWKLVATASLLSLLFFFIACHDQVGDDIMEITRNSTHALIVPAQIQQIFEKRQADHPEKKYALLELNETASGKLNELQTKYGLPKSLTVFKTENGKVVKGGVVRAESENTVLLQKDILARPKDEQTFLLMEYNEETNKVAELSQKDKIYTVVEEQPEFRGGYDSMIAFIRKNLRYTTEAREQGIEGTVYISFIVGTDGTVSEAKLIRGIGLEADREALRVVQLFPPWLPGKMNKEAVNVRFVLPIRFALNN